MALLSVYLLAEAENLRYAAEPRSIHVEGIERIKDAPAMEEALQEKLDEKTGWSVDNMGQLRRAARLDTRLRALRDDILPALVLNPTDDSALRRLVGQAQAIRRIGTKSSGHLRTLAVGLGNHLRTVAELVLSNKRPAAWLAERIGGIQVYVKKVHKRYYVPL